MRKLLISRDWGSLTTRRGGRVFYSSNKRDLPFFLYNFCKLLSQCRGKLPGLTLRPKLLRQAESQLVHSVPLTHPTQPLHPIREKLEFRCRNCARSPRGALARGDVRLRRLQRVVGGEGILNPSPKLECILRTPLLFQSEVSFK